MKRTPLRRKTALKARGRERFPKLTDRAYRAWIRAQACWAHGPFCWNGPPEITHVKSKGAGGGDRSNLLPLCAPVHRTQHRMGIASWAATYQLTVDDLKQAARDLDAVYQAMREEA